MENELPKNVTIRFDLRICRGCEKCYPMISHMSLLEGTKYYISCDHYDACKRAQKLYQN